MRRRALLATSACGGNENIFPMYIELTKTGNKYRHDPSPESIKLMDYFLENMQFNGVGHWEVSFPAGSLFIDNVEVKLMELPGTQSGPSVYNPYGAWYPCADYGSMVLQVYEFWLVDGAYPKGTLLVYDDD